MKDSKPIIKVSLPSAPALLLKASSQSDFTMWYNHIKLSTINAYAKKKLDDFSKSLIKMEQEIARSDKKEIAQYFTDVDAVLKFEECRNIAFENMGGYKREYRYLGELYDALQTFTTMCKLEKYNDAFSCAKKVHRMVTEFSMKEMSEDEPLAEDLINIEELEGLIRNMLRSLTTEDMVKTIATTLEIAEKEGLEKLKGTENTLFACLSRNLLKKIEAAQNEARSASKGKVTSQDLRLLAIPIARYKKTLQWTMPNILREIGLKQENFWGRKAMSMRVGASDRSSAGMFLPKSNTKIPMAFGAINFRNSGPGMLGDVRENTGMLDM